MSVTTEGEYWSPILNRLYQVAAAADMLALLKRLEHAGSVEIDYVSCSERCPLCEFSAPGHDRDCGFAALWEKHPKLRESL